MLPVDLSFPHRYALQPAPELPGTGMGAAPHWIPSVNRRPEHDGVWLQVVPEEGRAWTGVFAFGGGFPYSGIFTTPDPDRFCVVADGAAYLAAARDPADWRELPIFPVTRIHVLETPSLLLLTSFSRILALGAAGEVWRSEQLGADDLRIVYADSQRIDCTFYDPADDRGGRASIETATGRVLL